MLISALRKIAKLRSIYAIVLVGQFLLVGVNWIQRASFVILSEARTRSCENFPFNCQTAPPFAWTALASPPSPLLLVFVPPAPCGSHPRICSTSAAARSGNWWWYIINTTRITLIQFAQCFICHRCDSFHHCC